MTDRPKLIQEEYMDERPYGPWKVLVVCQLLNRTTYKQVEKVLDPLFNMLPRPIGPGLSASYTEAKLAVLLKPLGLSNERASRLIAMSKQFLATFISHGDRWEKYPVSSFSGCGQYAVDAWSLFVLRKACEPKDRRLKWYADKHFKGGEFVG